MGFGATRLNGVGLAGCLAVKKDKVSKQFFVSVRIKCVRISERMKVAPRVTRPFFRMSSPFFILILMRRNNHEENDLDWD